MTNFDDKSIKRIDASVNWTERQSERTLPFTKRPNVGAPNIVRSGVLLAGNTITARSGETPGSGPVRLQYCSDGTMQDDDEITAYNTYETELTTDGTNDLSVQVAYGDDAQWWVMGNPSSGGDDPSFVEGFLAEDMRVDSTAMLSVWTLDGTGWTDSSTDVMVRDRAGWGGLTGDYCMAVLLTYDGGSEYRPVVIGCSNGT